MLGCSMTCLRTRSSVSSRKLEYFTRFEQIIIWSCFYSCKEIFEISLKVLFYYMVILLWSPWIDERLKVANKKRCMFLFVHSSLFTFLHGFKWEKLCVLNWILSLEASLKLSRYEVCNAWASNALVSITNHVCSGRILFFVLLNWNWNGNRSVLAFPLSS